MPTDRQIDRSIDNTVSLVSITPSLAMLVVIKIGAGRRFGVTLACWIEYAKANVSIE